MAGHAARHRMDAVADLGPFAFKEVGQLLHLVLRLSQSHAVAGHDDHVFGILHQAGGCGFLAVPAGSGSSGGRAFAKRKAHQTVHSLGRVARHEYHAVAFVQGIGHACVAGLVVIVADDDVLAFVGLEDGHAVNGRAFRSIGRRVHNIVGPDDHHKVGIREHRIYNVHFQQVFVVHIGFGKQHIHVAGHAARHRMDAVAHLDALGHKRVGKLLHLVLGLRQSHTVTGHDNDAFGVLHQPGGCGFLAVAAGRGAFRRRSIALGIVQQRVKGLGGVAQHEVHASPLVQRVGHASIAGLVVIVADDDVFGFFSVKNGHAVDWRAFGAVGRRVHHVVGSNHNNEVGVREHRIYNVHFQQIFIVHVGFGKQHVHVAGHAARHRMDAVAHRSALAFQKVSKLLHLVLGLGQSHTVARHNDHLFGALHQPGNVGFAVFCLRGRGDSLGSGGLGRNHRGFAKQDGQQLSVHGLAHDARQQKARRADDAANGHQQGVIDRKTRNGRAHAAHGVQQRNGDGHVGPAHADGEANAKGCAGKKHQKDEESEQKVREDRAHKHRKTHNTQDAQDNLGMIGKDDRFLRQNLVQFARGHKGARDGGHAHSQSQAGAAAFKGRRRARVRQDEKAYDGRSPAANAVQKGDHLRHLDHLDLVGQGKPQSHTHGNGQPQRGRQQRTVLEHGHKNGETHGRSAKKIALDRGGNPVHEAQAKENRRHKKPGDDVVGQCIHVTATLILIYG